MKSRGVVQESDFGCAFHLWSAVCCDSSQPFPHPPCANGLCYFVLSRGATAAGGELSSGDTNPRTLGCRVLIGRYSIEMAEDSNLGLIFDGTSDSCASDLSDSQHSDLRRSFLWHENLQDACEKELPHVENDEDIEICQSSSLSGDRLRELSFDQTDDCCRQSSPQTPSFRSRLGRSPDESSREYAQLTFETSWQENKRAHKPRMPSLRFCLTLFTATLAFLSLIPHVNRDSKSAAEELSDQLRREEVPFPIYAVPGSLAHSHKQGREKNSSGTIPRYSLSPDQASSTQSGRHQPNLAMARSQDRRPVFGIPDPEVERFMLGSEGSGGKVGSDTGVQYWNYKLVMWLGGAVLVALVVEGSHKKLNPSRSNENLQELRRL